LIRKYLILRTGVCPTSGNGTYEGRGDLNYNWEEEKASKRIEGRRDVEGCKRKRRKKVVQEPLGEKVKFYSHGQKKFFRGEIGFSGKAGEASVRDLKKGKKGTQRKNKKFWKREEIRGL